MHHNSNYTFFYLIGRQRERLEDLLRNISPQRTKVAETMVFCMEHSEAAEEICECIAESLSLMTTALPKKVMQYCELTAPITVVNNTVHLFQIARLYLISDILHNCGVKITNASYYRRG
jgi:U2-associated protein SR140